MALLGGGLVGEGAVAARLHADPSMYVAALRGLLVQVAHPHVAAGVADHSQFEVDPWSRLRRTTEFINAVTYGSRREAEAAVATVRRVHERVRGVDVVTGQAYRADDPELMLWVHVALVHSVVKAYRRYGGWLPRGTADRYVLEMHSVAGALGIAEAPRTLADVRSTLRDMTRSLSPSPGASQVLALILAPPVSPVLRPLAAVVTAAAVALLPRSLQDLYGVRTRRVFEPAVRSAAVGLFAGIRVGTEVPRLVLGPARWAATAGPLQSVLAALSPSPPR